MDQIKHLSVPDDVRHVLDKRRLRLALIALSALSLLVCLLTTHLLIDFSRPPSGLPIIPHYGPPTIAQLGFDHIYVIHTHPQRPGQMSRVLQMLQITAEFVAAPVVPPGNSTLPARRVAEWHAHMGVYRDMRERGFESALILDGSVDMELNIKTIMRRVHRVLPSWDLLFPGHCGAFERIQPRVSAQLPMLRVANMPLCLHAYAVSRSGVDSLLDHLAALPPDRDILGMAIMRLAEQRRLAMYSLDTPVFVPESTDKTRRLAGNKRLAISAINHLHERQQ
ncbi:hypothetical protein IWW55_004119 [Coemansia sp. RSA 2706]|nr:hypothetical protein LPJ70_004883 [Coemansia sp. RSA 2708]KAJ2299683.1 hypothetical protein IWW55_004119 [Coemansia sp. RSA 2706]KAJ2323670.1 hypothetical protein IWW51_003643 [Coemansia sp. RSA 2702]